MTKTERFLEIAEEKGLNVRFLINEPMKNHTTFQIGGPADLMAIPQNRESFIALMDLLEEYPIPSHIIGNGSNLLVSDEGIEGVVVRTDEALTDIACHGAIVRAGAGVPLKRLSVYCTDHSLSGFEFAHGIPGTLGGAVYMNAGAYGGEMSSVVRETEYYKGGAIFTARGKAHEFSYRKSFFSGRPDCLILSSVLGFETGNPSEINAKIADFTKRRIDKQPLNFPSAGSVFKRPEGFFAGKLIQDAGLCGAKVGGAQVSDKHAGFIINRGGATCSDVLTLIGHIKNTVYQKFSVILECEIKIVGRRI